jgi:hypothetical protein
MKEFFLSVGITFSIVCLVLGVGMWFFPLPASPTPAPLSPIPATPVVRVMDSSLTPFAAAWQVECERRFPGCLVVLTHGGTFVNGQWFLLTAASDPQVEATDAHTILDRLIAQYPNRTICLLACNDASYHLTGYPNVLFSPSEVWCCPDRNVDDPAFADNHLTFRTMDGDDDAPPDGLDGDSPPTSRWASAPAVVGNAFELIQAN